MSKTPVSLTVGDVSSFSKSIRRSLDNMERVPTHVEMLNIVAKAEGFKNYQHLKSQAQARAAFEKPSSPPPAEVDYKRLKQLVRYFDADGKLVRWPGKYTHRLTCLWVMWSRIPARKVFSEKEISQLIDMEHLFGDHALIRRELVDRSMIERTPDGRQYKRLEVRPPAEALALLERVRSH